MAEYEATNGVPLLSLMSTRCPCVPPHGRTHSHNPLLFLPISFPRLPSPNRRRPSAGGGGIYIVLNGHRHEPKVRVGNVPGAMRKERAVAVGSAAAATAVMLRKRRRQESALACTLLHRFPPILSKTQHKSDARYFLALHFLSLRFERWSDYLEPMNSRAPSAPPNRSCRWLSPPAAASQWERRSLMGLSPPPK